MRRTCMQDNLTIIILARNRQQDAEKTNFKPSAVIPAQVDIQKFFEEPCPPAISDLLCLTGSARPEIHS